MISGGGGPHCLVSALNITNLFREAQNHWNGMIIYKLLLQSTVSVSAVK